MQQYKRTSPDENKKRRASGKVSARGKKRTFEGSTRNTQAGLAEVHRKLGKRKNKAIIIANHKNLCKKLHVIIF